MAELLPVRAFNRSQRVRIGLKALSPTVTKYVNLSNPRVRRDISRHSAIGAILPLGTPVTFTDSGYVVQGGEVTASNPAALTVAVPAGVWNNAGTNVSFAAATGTITTADATNPRIDLVVVNNAGAVSVVAGTPAASPVRPAVPANSVALAQVSVPATDTAITADQITDLR